MKLIKIAAAATIAAATLTATAAIAQGSSRAIAVPKRHVAPSTGFTGGFPFGIVRENPSHHDGRRHHSRRGHRDRGGHSFEGDYFAYGYGDGDGYVDTIPMTDEPGYFSNGGSVTFDGVRPVYDYDRSYPYEHYRGGSGASAPAVAAQVHCQVQNVQDEGSGRQAQVRICRRS